MQETPPAVDPPRRGVDDGILLEFLAPGLVHSLGNHLFAIQGCAHVLREGQVSQRQRATILEAATQAESALDVLRLLGSGESIERREQAGVLLARLAPICRVPLRDRGLRLEIDHSSARRPRVVDARGFSRVVVDLLLRVAGQLPAFVEGTIHLDLADQDAHSVALELGIEFEPTCLPFPMDLSVVGEDLVREHDPQGVVVTMLDDDTMRVRVPVAQ